MYEIGEQFIFIFYLCAMKKETIQLKKLTIGYPLKKVSKIVAADISASIHAGELTCLLGANGVGKSTLLRTLSGFQSKLSGQIFIAGQEIDTYSDKQLSKVLSVVLTEKGDLYNLSVAELVGLGRTPYTGFWGVLTSKDKEIVSMAMELTGITHLAHRMAHTLSDGERQKAMIAKALAQETPVVFLDEPTAFLDFPSKVEMLLLLHRLSRETQKTIFLSTHDLELALQIADKIWLMHPGEGVLVGTPEDMALNGNLARFFGRKNVVFEPVSGLFRVQHTCHREVSLAGKSVVTCAMVQKALYRCGIQTVENPEGTVHIQVLDEGGFEIRYPQGSLCVISIGELLEVLAGLLS